MGMKLQNRFILGIACSVLLGWACLVLSGCSTGLGGATETPTASVTPKPSSTPQPTETPQPTVTATANPYRTPTLPPSGNTDQWIAVNDDSSITFPKWGFSADTKLNEWKIDPVNSITTKNFESFGFQHHMEFDKNGKVFSPYILFTFYPVTKGTTLDDFSGAMFSNKSKSFPGIESTFGYPGMEPLFQIPALGYRVHYSRSGITRFIVHALKGTVALEFQYSVYDAVLDQAESDFSHIVESMMFLN
jgi:hypothetical protein